MNHWQQQKNFAAGILEEVEMAAVTSLFALHD